MLRLREPLPSCEQHSGPGGDVHGHRCPVTRVTGTGTVPPQALSHHYSIHAAHFLPCRCNPTAVRCESTPGWHGALAVRAAGSSLVPRATL